MPKSKKRNGSSAGDTGNSEAHQLSVETRDDLALRFGDRIYLTSRQMGGKTPRKLDILPDLPDIRDRIYQPSLRALAPSIFPRIAFPIRDQGKTNSCTGHSLAHVIDSLLYSVLTEQPYRVSARMLYEMALRNDEWADTPHEGSSLRGALKGFFRNGVCRQEETEQASADWMLTYERAKQARETRLGAYFRLQPDMSDYHAALNEVGAIYVSAQIHDNWLNPVDGRIQPGGRPCGGHAFVIVGYDSEGFWILNSWGADWGKGGVAHWAYGDWASTIMDAWVLQLGVRAPDAFDLRSAKASLSNVGLFGLNDPSRQDILGHFVNIDDGKLILKDKYASPTKEEMQETVKRLTMEDSNKGQGFSHLMIYLHGGLNSKIDCARRIATWNKNDIFGRNGIYQFHLMWASDLIGEAFGPMSDTRGLAGGGMVDWFFEAGPIKASGQRAWRNMKSDAEAAFSGRSGYDGGYLGLKPLLEGLDKAGKRPKVHLVGHSAGSIMIGRLLSAFARFKLSNIKIESIQLMAPACTVDFFEKYYRPLLRGTSTNLLSDKIYIYMMNDKLELADRVGLDFPPSPSYSHSLLYLVSRAFEEAPKTPLAGMEIYQGGIPPSPRLKIDKSISDVTAATSHGGFDNDAATLTAVITRILGTKPKPGMAPRQDELTGY